MKLNIIISVYNREKYIARCIESALNQDLDNYEIVIVNDGSTDNSEKIIQKYLEEYPEKIKYKLKENGGVSSARNEGLKMAEGQYITYIDSDDYAIKNCYKKIYDIAKENDYDIVIYNAKKIFSDREEELKAISCNESRIISKEEYILSMPCPWNKIIKKSLIEKEKFEFPEGICYEDLAMIPTLGQNANKIYYLNEQCINYFQSEDSIMRQESFKQRYLDIYEALNVLENKLNSKYNKELEYIYWNNLLVEFSLIFYKYNRYDLINKNADIMKEKFKDWEKNPYIKKANNKERIYSKIFFKKKIYILKMLQKIKHLLGGTKNVK